MMISVKKHTDEQLLDFMDSYCTMSEDAFTIGVDSRMILLCMEKLNYSLDACTVFYYSFYDSLNHKNDEMILKYTDDDCKPAMKNLLEIVKEKNKEFDFEQRYFDKIAPKLYDLHSNS